MIISPAMKPITRPALRNLIHRIFDNKKGTDFKEVFLADHFSEVYKRHQGETDLTNLITLLGQYHFKPNGTKILTALQALDAELFEREYVAMFGEAWHEEPPLPPYSAPSAVLPAVSPSDATGSLAVRDRSAALAYMRNAHAMVIGIADYEHLPKLESTRNDAQDVAATLTDLRMCGYPKEQVRLVLEKEATKERIEAELVSLARATNAESTVFIFFAGHGGRIKEGPKAGHFLLPVDARGQRKFGVEEYLKTTISDARLSQLLSDIPARKQIVVLDCCYAGGVATLRSSRERDEGEFDEAEGGEDASSEMIDHLMHNGKGRVILAATNRGETAKELVSDRNGLFTKHLLEALRGAGGTGYFVDVFEVYRYVHRLVAATSLPSPQTPSLKVDMEEPSFYLAVRSLKYLQ